MINGLPPRIYRSPQEIRSDIRDISSKIRESSEMLNIRSLLTELLMSERSDSPERLIPELEGTIEEASLALARMRELSEELSLLEEELSEVRWQIGM